MVDLRMAQEVAFHMLVFGGLIGCAFGGGVTWLAMIRKGREQ